MTYSKETLEATMHALTVDNAMRMIALAGNKGELESLVRNLARNFNADIPATAYATIRAASLRWHVAKSNRQISYGHS